MNATASEGFRPLKVIDNVRESRTITSFHLAPTEPPVTDGAITVTFRKSGRSVSWVDGAGSLLSFAESHGLAPDFSCRAGVCGTCKTGLIEGEVAYFEEPLDDPGAGQVLICCARPTCAVVLDL